MTTKPPRVAVMCSNPSCPLRQDCKRGKSEASVNQMWKHFWPLAGACEGFIKWRAK